MTCSRGSPPYKDTAPAPQRTRSAYSPAMAAPPLPFPLLILLLLLAVSSSTVAAAAAIGAPVLGEDYVRPPPSRSHRKALLSLFPWSKKKESSSASDPQQVNSRASSLSI